VNASVPSTDSTDEWAAEQFRAAGIKNVKLEPWTMPNGWNRGLARGRITSPLDRPIHIESLGWAPSTPPDGVKAEVIEFGDLDPNKIKAQTDKFKGRVVMQSDPLIRFSRVIRGLFEGELLSPHRAALSLTAVLRSPRVPLS
jgi:hypothetical protein